VNKLTYDTNSYRFAETLEKVFLTKDLSTLHENLKTFNVDTDQSSKYHRVFYKLRDDHSFFVMFRRFVENEVYPLFDEDILFQKKPTFRIHMKGNLAVGGYHKDRDYNHSEHEINFFVPLTEAFESNTVWVESEEDKGDFAPMEASYGEYYMWNGANLTHGNKKNSTGRTRVSFDFRVLPKSKYKASGKKSITQGVPFELGKYYDEI
tara:strand:+ start:7477 stop:8097 length:621 start_codon:yes stop_codon:yes gene_type:complete